MLDLEFQLGVKEVDVLKLWPDLNILEKSIGFSETRYYVESSDIQFISRKFLEFCDRFLAGCPVQENIQRNGCPFILQSLN
jgi:hypothetical protein